MPLEKYRAKRSAETTPEPFGRGGADRPHLFVVQKHAARALHYDFRLEWGGVLKSWAVPKGPSPDPADKRLAVEVEDHPVEYADFEGRIPEGNYGAGTVIVWDRGRWTPIGDPEEGAQKGKILFELSGYKLRGIWTLVRTKRKGQPQSREWLLIKERDAQARPGGAATLPQESILSGLTLEELASGETCAGEIRAELERLGAVRKHLRAADVELMLAETREQAFTKKGWLWEIKYDGYRVLASREGSEARLTYRHGMDSTGIFPEIARALRALPFESLVIDGEIVVNDEKGKPSFGKLQKRALLSRQADIERALVELPAVFYGFDLVACEGFDLRRLPLLDRKALLARLLPKAGPLRFCDHVAEQGEALLEEARALGLEGIVGKKADSRYHGGRSADWVKVRLERTEDFAVVGYSAPKGSRAGFGALHLGIYDAGKLIYAGRAGSGFTERQLEHVRERLAPDARKTPPCSGELPSGKEHVWVEPRLVCEVRYKEWPEGKLLRQPVFLRMRDDKRPEECVRASPAAEAAAPQPKLDPVEKTVPLSNLEKVFWPDEGYTKGDLIEYYRQIAPWLLPYLKDRPIVMARYPDGIKGKSFYQKDAPSFAPPWLRTVRIWSEGTSREIDYFVCDDVESLLYVANLGSIPLHVWASRVDSLERPDWSVLDLDPKGAPFSHVVEVARAIHGLCEEIEMPAFIKTSGATGLHILLPLGGQCTYTESRTLAEILAKVVEQQLPTIATTVRSVGARGGRVYIDFLQNVHGQTIAGPFSARPMPGATASAPLKWSEVNAKLDVGKFTIQTLPARMKRLKEDPLSPVLTLKPDLARTLARLTERLKTP
ncbi:MAG TPA: DNA ligase D [Thermoanaerobaculia bacterium]|nr:DNA ligase D [Thermoanaerobaculia bacterium]